MTNRKTLLEDKFEYRKTPFLVTVEEREMFINRKTNEVKKINFYGAPSGMKKAARNWVVCRAQVARVRPNYPYTQVEEWPHEVDRHVSIVQLLEEPIRKKLFIFPYWTTEEKDPDKTPKELAKKTIEKLKAGREEYEDRVQKL